MHLILDGGPNETLKDNVIVMSESASLDESMESVMVESTVGPAIQIKIVAIKLIMTLW